MDISLIFTTRNRGSQLEQTLDHYRALDTENIQWELVIVDNGSSDNTAEVLKEAAGDLPLRVHYYPTPGKNAALNQVIDSLSGELVIFTDDDALPERNCLQAYLKAAGRWPNDGIFGAHIVPLFPADTPAWMKEPDCAFAKTAFAHYYPHDHEATVTRHPYGPSFAVRKSLLGQRRFPEHLGPRPGAYATGGEAMFLRELRQEGNRFVFVPSAKVHHVVRPEQTRKEWLLQRAYKRGRGQAHIPATRHRNGVKWRGVAMKLRLATLRAWIRYRLFAPLLPRQRHVELGFTYEMRNGELQELHRIHRSKTRTAS